MDLTTLSSLRACRTLKTVVKRKFFTTPIDPFVTSDVSDAQNCGKMRILAPARVTLSSLRACRTLKTVVKCKFLSSPSNPFVTSDVSDAQNCGKMHGHSCPHAPKHCNQITARFIIKKTTCSSEVHNVLQCIFEKKPSQF